MRLVIKMGAVITSVFALAACNPAPGPEPSSTVFERGEWGLTDDYDYVVYQFSTPYRIKGIDADFKVTVKIKPQTVEEIQQDLEDLRTGNIKKDPDYDPNERSKTFKRICSKIGQTYNTLELVDGEGSAFSLFIECI